MGNNAMCIDCEAVNTKRNRRERLRPHGFVAKNLIQIKRSPISEDYQLDLQAIGSGTSGTVLKVVRKDTKIARACKKVLRKSENLSELTEVFLLKKLDHPNIITIYEIYVESTYIYIVMELCEGGELFDRIIQRGKLTENEARRYMRQILSAVSNCHENNIMHRDLKPENIMFLDKNSQILKIVDFGAGLQCEATEKVSLKIGSMCYMAPEVLSHSYDKKCDVWSLGIILYIMVSGVPPFFGHSDEQLAAKIQEGRPKFEGPKWEQASGTLISLIRQMLQPNPDLRVSARAALHHNWFTHIDDNNSSILLENDLKSMKAFSELTSFQSAVLAYIAHNLSHSTALERLEFSFQRIDTDKDGKISWFEFQQCYMQSDLPYIEHDELLKTFSAIDTNRSTFIDYSEFLLASSLKKYFELGPLIERAFHLIDKNCDGFLETSELREALGGASEIICQQILIECGKDKEGAISKQDFLKAMEGVAAKAKYYLR